ncbi:MAG: TlpA disulfide reductase family protein [Anaerolineales bacterium]
METLLVVSSILLWVVLLFNLLLSFQLIRIVAPNVWAQNAAKLKSGQAAPDFKATDLDGKSITLASFRGRPLLLAFVSPSCSACLDRLDEIRSLAANMPGLQVALVCDSNEPISRALANEYRLEVPVMAAFRNQAPIWSRYKAAATPYYCLVDGKSRVQAAGPFDAGWEALSEAWRLQDGQDGAP